MPNDAFKITLHLVTSLDGMIAKKDNSVAWFDTPDNFEKGIGFEGAEDVLKSIDCYIMGARTYEHALTLSKSYGWPYGEVPTIVLTHRHLTVEKKNVELYAGDLATLVERKLKPAYKNVWLVGGAALARDFLRLRLADEIRLSVIPIILGAGAALFDQAGIEQLLHLKEVTAYKTGMVELWYEVKK